MKRKVVATALAALSFGIAAPRAFAADHGDGPAAKADPTSDITDLYAWMSSDASKVYLVMDVFPNATTAAKFSNAVKYVFHVASSPGLGMPPADLTNVICTFDTAQKASCWVVDAKAGSSKDFVSGDASATAGIVSSDMKVKLFAGLRDDPFFFNLEGFHDAADTVSAVKGGLTFDTNGCPMLDQATATAAAGLLSHTQKGTMPAKDALAGKNVLSIVMAIDKTLLTSTGNPLVSVWASTNQ